MNQNSLKIIEERLL